MSSDAEEASEDRRKYRFKKVTEGLRGHKESGTQLVTIYIPEDEQISDVVEHVTTEYSEASNIKSKQTRTNVQDTLTSIKDRLRYYGNFPPGSGIVMLSGAVDTSDDQTTMVTEVLESPPEPVQPFRYHYNSSSLTGPLEDILMNKGLLDLIVLDRHRVSVGWFKGKCVEPVKNASSLIPGRQRKGGQSTQRFVRLRLEATDNFYREVTGMTNGLFVPKCHDVGDVLMDGPSPTKDEFLDGGYFHHELQDLVVGRFDVAHTDEPDLYNLVGAGQDTLVDQEVIKDKKQTGEFFEKLHRGNEPTYGLEATRRNLVMGSVNCLLISEDLRKDVAAYDCSGQEEYELVDHRHDVPTHECDDGSEAELKDRKDVIEQLMDLADRHGTETKFISTDFGKGEQLHDTFGGITGVLRYSTGV